MKPILDIFHLHSETKLSTSLIALIENREPEFGGKMGIESIKVVEAAYKAVKTGKTQNVK